jgi:hypothetical protein
MKKIISLFKRDYGKGPRLVFNEVVEGAEWVLAGEGVATIKYDGTCCLFRDGKLYKRYDAKHGKKPPADFEAAQDPDPLTGHWPGWVPVTEAPEDRWHMEAWRRIASEHPTSMPGTYELVGPKIGGNPYGLSHHELWAHGGGRATAAPRTFDELREFFERAPIEGIVWHHPDGRMAKIKRRDFGLPWPLEAP